MQYLHNVKLTRFALCASPLRTQVERCNIPVDGSVLLQQRSIASRRIGSLPSECLMTAAAPSFDGYTATLEGEAHLCGQP